MPARRFSRMAETFFYRAVRPAKDDHLQDGQQGITGEEPGCHAANTADFLPDSPVQLVSSRACPGSMIRTGVYLG
jgi:hypothetical protein